MFESYNAIAQMQAVKDMFGFQLNDSGSFNRSGYFITLLTTHVENHEKISDNRMMEVQDKVGRLVNRLNRFCYGEQYSNRLCKLDAASFIEIGLGNRLHAHLICLHTQKCTREFQHFECLVRKEWKSILKLKQMGRNFVHTEEFKEHLNWSGYLIKDIDKLSRNNGLCSVTIH